jgi:hypothetical protein
MRSTRRRVMATGDPGDSPSGDHDHGPTAGRIMLGAQLRQAAEISRADAGYATRGSEM